MKKLLSVKSILIVSSCLLAISCSDDDQSTEATGAYSGTYVNSNYRGTHGGYNQGRNHSGQRGQRDRADNGRGHNQNTRPNGNVFGDVYPDNGNTTTVGNNLNDYQHNCPAVFGTLTATVVNAQNVQLNWNVYNVELFRQPAVRYYQVEIKDKQTNAMFISAPVAADSITVRPSLRSIDGRPLSAFMQLREGPHFWYGVRALDANQNVLYSNKGQILGIDFDINHSNYSYVDQISTWCRDKGLN